MSCSSMRIHNYTIESYPDGTLENQVKALIQITTNINLAGDPEGPGTSRTRDSEKGPSSKLKTR